MTHRTTQRTRAGTAALAALALGATVLGACAGAGAGSADRVLARGGPPPSAVATTTAPAPTTATQAPATSDPATTSASPATSSAPSATTGQAPDPSVAGQAAPPTSEPRPHTVHEQDWTPYAFIQSVTLHHPADQVEAIGFHQSGHDGAHHQTAVAGSAPWFTMESRNRDTDPHGAADIVVPPGREIRAPVTGTVVRAGRYTLYCDHVDEYAVIEPDARPGWEVKVLHVEGLAVAKGQRVEAGVTRLAANARVLPFPSQVEETTGEPPWPHVHVEVVDPSIPDRPTGGGC